MIDYLKLGFSINLDFISQQEEIDILNNIIKKEHRQILHRNSIQRFGSSLPYNSNIISKTIPEFLDTLCEKLIITGMTSTKPDSVTINEYLKGQKIAPHIDSKKSGDIISIISLLSEATMKFKYQNEEFSVLIPNRSLIQMKNEIRYKWYHSIDSVLNKRYSIVFRCSKTK